MGAHRATRPGRIARRGALACAVLGAVGGAGAWVLGLYPAHARAAAANASVDRVAVANDTSPWRPAWALSLGHSGTLEGTDLTCRLIARPAMSGSQVRFRLINYPADSAVTFSHLVAGRRVRTMAVDPTSVRDVLVGGKESVTIPPGGEVLTDPVDLPVERGQDVALSVSVSAGVSSPWHYWSAQTSGCTAPGEGDTTADTGGAAFTEPSEDRWLSEVQVLPAPSATPATIVAAYGDSLTDGAFLAPDTLRRWTDRLQDESAGRLVVLNYGVSGDRITDSAHGVLPARFATDVLRPAGVSAVIVEMGSNDIRNGADAKAVLAQYQRAAAEVERSGKQLIVVTVPPRDDAMPASAERQRKLLNAGLRQYPLVADIDAALTDPVTGKMYARLAIGDHVHPNQAGVAVIAAVIRQTLSEAGGPVAASVR